MALSNTSANDVLKKLLNDTALPWDAITDWYAALHTADPGAAGIQTTSEATYTGYARIAVARTAGGWTVAGVAASNAALVQFPVCTAGSDIVTYVSIGTTLAAGGQILLRGALTAPRSISAGIQPQFNAGVLVLTSV